ncbi:MAG: hypothetical protein KAY37_09250, partial [Phycisphaerae bacterium]|nr:hypothetical protein [Phycisphaerae bacterium]
PAGDSAGTFSDPPKASYTRLQLAARQGPRYAIETMKPLYSVTDRPPYQEKPRRPHLSTTGNPQKYRAKRPGALQIPAVCLVLLALTPAGADQMLQYRLDVGDRLVFERQATVSALETGEPLGRVTDQVQLWCLARRQDELLVLVELNRSSDGSAEPARAVVLYVGEGGRRRCPAETQTRLDPLYPALDLLPVLPIGPQSEAEWRTPPDLYQRRWHCTRRGTDPAHAGRLRIDFVVEDPLGVADVLGHTRSGSYWFDPRVGLVTRFESEEADQTRETRTKAVGVLRERLEQSPAWCARRADEAERFLRTLNHEERLLHEVVSRPEALPRTYTELDRLWLAFKTDVDDRALSPFATIADARRQDLRAAADAFPARSELGRRWLNQPAVTWTLQDAAGETVICEAARQGVVIECFWSGESVWGLRVLEPMRRLQAALPRHRVRLICYNMDREVERARAVIERCGGPSPTPGRRPSHPLLHILGGPLREVETLPELPLVRVLDREGIVRGVWVGWHPTYSAARELALELAGQPTRSRLSIISRVTKH